MPISELTKTPFPIKLWAHIHEVESQAIDQLKNIASLPWIYKHVAVMPDVHLGKGATVGSVVAMQDAISPSAVGVDIGCGMAAIKTNLKASDLPDNLKAIRSQIERDIPVGFNKLSTPSKFCAKHKKLLTEDFKKLDPRVQDLAKNTACQCGTLGGGNHFIELCLDQDDDVWLMLHSGSRNIGKSLAEIHINIAKTLEHNQKLPDRDLAVFLNGTPEMAAYRRDLNWAQQYAYANREVMMDTYKELLQRFFPQILFGEYITCHHNYVAEEVHYGEQVFVTRKGAISAKEGEWGIIPGSMGTKSYIVKGLGNPEAFHSASHGAGRRFSRGEAKRRFTKEDAETQLSGVECRMDEGIYDELPGAYKDIDQVMENQKDLVQVVYELKQVLCVKG